MGRVQRLLGDFQAALRLPDAGPGRLSRFLPALARNRLLWRWRTATTSKPNASQTRPTSAAGRLSPRLGNIAARRGGPDDAIAKYDEALTLDPTHVRAGSTDARPTLRGTFRRGARGRRTPSWYRPQIFRLHACDVRNPKNGFDALERSR
ncbi:MAG: hypothetical protein CM15mP18_3940 [Methanobacteriota archaeon]|nr:MAG: hypothetical protein CM15mP18_3940 [Euryarchaeota archaeon]